MLGIPLRDTWRTEKIREIARTSNMLEGAKGSKWRRVGFVVRSRGTCGVISDFLGTGEGESCGKTQERWKDKIRKY